MSTCSQCSGEVPCFHGDNRTIRCDACGGTGEIEDGDEDVYDEGLDIVHASVNGEETQP